MFEIIPLISKIPHNLTRVKILVSMPSKLWTVVYLIFECSIAEQYADYIDIPQVTTTNLWILYVLICFWNDVSKRSE